MPRKPRGLFGRLAGAAGKLTSFFPKRKKPAAPAEPPLRPLPPERPRQRPPPEQPPSIPLETRYLEKYVKVTGGILDFPDWEELWEPMGIIFDTDAEKARYFEMFLRAYYLTSHEPGSVPRARFHRISSIPDSQLDWEQWRDMRRGTP